MVGVKLKNIRKRRGISQKDLSEKCGVSYGSLKRFEETGQISLLSLTKIAMALDCSPAYDLTYSNTYFGEHTTSVDGNGKDPGKKELIAVGTGAGISRKKCEQMADKVQEITQEMLSRYL